MKKLLLATLGAIVLVVTSGCVVAPVGPPRAVVVVPAPEPYYASPGAGYVWAPHPDYGYGWHHPNNGWHRGWR